jgi:peptidoglycan/LPS O-acetylase OafA/YrhL
MLSADQEGVPREGTIFFSMPVPKRQILPLTGMRFFLALWVVIFHHTSATGILSAPVANAPSAVSGILRTGYVAVGIFFVLSGFILSYNYQLGQPWSRSEIVRFGIARFSKIYPVYCLGLLLIAPVTLHYVNFSSAPEVRKQAAIAFANWALLQSWTHQWALTWNFPGWSVSAEAFFYVCFPFVGIALWRRSSYPAILSTVLILWLAGLVPPLVVMAMSVHGLGDIFATSQPVESFWTNFIKFNPLLHLTSFCAGILFARFYILLRDSNHSLLGRGHILYLPGIVIGGTLLTFSPSIPHPLLHNGLLLPLYGCVIVGLALGGGPVARVLSHPVLTLLGDASYSMYILHYPVFAWLNAGPVRQKFSLSKMVGIGGMAIYLTILIAVSVLVFKTIEEPLHRLLKRRLTLRFARPEPRDVSAAEPIGAVSHSFLALE